MGDALAPESLQLLLSGVRCTEKTNTVTAMLYQYKYILIHSTGRHGGGQGGRISNCPCVFYTGVVYWQKDIFAWLSDR